MQALGNESVVCRDFATIDPRFLDCQGPGDFNGLLFGSGNIRNTQVQVLLTEIQKENAKEFCSIIDVLNMRMKDHYNKAAFSYVDFLENDQTKETNLTYGEIVRKARRISDGMRKKITPGDAVILLYPPGLEYITAFFSCLYAGVVAVPAYPPVTSSMQYRLQTIISDSKSAYFLSDSTTYDLLRSYMDIESQFKTMKWLLTDKMMDDIREPEDQTFISGDDIAFIQYTSGSTANPKGVRITHHNVLHNLMLIQQSFETTSEQKGVFWLPLYHDMGLIGGMLHNVYVGATTALFSPLDFLRKPYRWLKILSETRGNVSGGPNFSYELCVKKVTSEQIKELDLSSWEVAANGAESIRPETMDRFFDRFKVCGFRKEAFYPCYGLAESTLIVSGSGKKTAPVVMAFNANALEKNKVEHIPDPDSKSVLLVSCGAPLKGNHVIIVNPETGHRCGANEVGEIWVESKSVAKDYYNKPEETGYTFMAYCPDDGDGPFLRTGDLGFLFEGELFFTGRLKDLIKIRGNNYYPDDIEDAIEACHPSLRTGCNAAFSVDMDGEEKLVIVQEIDRKFPDVNRWEVSDLIRKKVSMRFRLPVYETILIKHGSIHKTSSGKIRRGACRLSYLAETLARI